jgi:hypothetical protein
MSTSGHTSRHRGFRWAWAIPVAELLLAIAMISGPLIRMHRVHAFFKHVRQDQHGVIPMGQLTPEVSTQKQTQWQSLSETLPGATQTIVLFNFPGLLINTVVSHFTLWSSWLGPLNYPLDVWMWRALVCPVYALPFWWILGRSLDCAASMRKGSLLPLRRWDIALMLPLAMICSAGAVSFSLTAIAADPADHDFVFLIVAMGLWSLLSIFVCVIWLLQWKKLRSPWAHTLATTLQTQPVAPPEKSPTQ